jgi:hypothetical protein
MNGSFNYETTKSGTLRIQGVGEMPRLRFKASLPKEAVLWPVVDGGLG